MKRKYPLCLAIVIGLTVTVGSSACHRAASVDETPDNSTYRPLPTPATELEQKLKLMRDAHFQYVWLFSRKDEKEFTSEDKELLHTNAPRVVDWVGMDDKKRFFAGSNFVIDPKNLEVLQKRYKIEDYSGK